jgi:DNA-binding FadR family transcriptional regulator
MIASMTQMGAATLPTSKRGSIYGHVIDSLGIQIVSGNLPAGKTLFPEPQLATDLGVSRGILREAVKGLVSKGLLEIGPRTGTIVRPRSDWNFLDQDVLRWFSDVDRTSLFSNLTELRGTIEPGAAAIAAQRATDDDRAELTAAFARMQASQNANPAEFIEADVAFHGALLRACHNDLFISLGNVLEFVLRGSFETSSNAPGAIRASLPQHGLILAAVVAADPTSASSAATRLITSAVHDLDVSVQTVDQAAVS